MFQIVNTGALPLFVSMLKYDDIEEQICAATALWNLSFDDTSRDLIKKEPGCIEALKNLQKSDNETARYEANGALFEIIEKNSGQIGKADFVIHWRYCKRLFKYKKMITIGYTIKLYFTRHKLISLSLYNN